MRKNLRNMWMFAWALALAFALTACTSTPGPEPLSTADATTTETPITTPTPTLGPDPTPEPQPPPPDYTVGFFWEVRGGANTVYLLGSIHAGDDSLYPLSDRIYDAYSRSDFLVMEIDLTSISMDDYQYMQTHGVIDPASGQTIRDFIPAEVYELYAETCEAFGIAAETYDYMMPWLAQTELFLLLTFGDVGIMNEHVANGFDYSFTMTAVQDGTPIMELESFKMQVDVLSSMSEAYQAFALQEMLEGANTPAANGQGNALYEETQLLFDIVRTGDEARLEAYLEESISVNNPLHVEYYEKFIVERNHGMVDGIAKLLSEDAEPGTYFVVVGTAHMPGYDGIVYLLEEMGYFVDRIR